MLSGPIHDEGFDAVQQELDENMFDDEDIVADMVQPGTDVQGPLMG